MKREEHLEICKLCTNRAFDHKRGIICGLTNEIADFEINCTYFKTDEVAIKNKELYEKENPEPTYKTHDAVTPELKVKSAARWFYWISGLTLINAVSAFLGSDISVYIPEDELLDSNI